MQVGGGAEAEHALAYDDSEELMDRLQAEAWRRKYEGGLARLQQLERDNQRMREALVRVETLVPVRSPPPLETKRHSALRHLGTAARAEKSEPAESPS